MYLRGMPRNVGFGLYFGREITAIFRKEAMRYRELILGYLNPYSNLLLSEWPNLNPLLAILSAKQSSLSEKFLKNGRPKFPKHD